MISKQKEIFNKLADKILDDITELKEKIDRNDLIYRHKGETPDETFNAYNNALDLINKIQNGEIKVAEAKMIR